MMRYLKILFLAMMGVGLIASSAFAAGNMSYQGAGGVWNTTLNVALEAMGTGRNYTMTTGSTNTGTIVAPALYFTPGQALISGSLVTITFTNAGFDGSTVYLCQMNAANNMVGTAAPIASASTTANSTSQGFVLTANSAAGNTVMITTASNALNCANNGAFIVKFLPISSAGMATITYNATYSGQLYDSGNAVNNFANISKQFSTAYNAINSYIDYLNAPANGSKFATNTVYTAASGSIGSGSTANISNAYKDVATVASGLTVSALVSLQDSAGWQGVSSVYGRNNGTTCGATGTNNVANNSPSGTVNLTIPTDVFDGSTAAASGCNITLCVKIAGNAVLQTRTIKAATDISVTGTGPNDPSIDTYRAVMNWLTNGYQGMIPYVYGGSAYQTMCMINNKSLASAPVTVDILTAESGASLASLTALAVGTLAAQGTMRVTFDTSLTPYTYSGGVETAGTATALTGLQSNDRYSAMINVGADPTQITVNCLMSDPAGSRRAIPVLTQNSSTTYNWQQ